MNRQSALLYPFSLSTASIPRYKHLINLFELKKLVSPKSLGIGGKDSSLLDEGSPTGMLVSTVFEDALESCETVIAAEFEFETDERYLNKVLKNLELAMTKGKNIYCTLTLKSTLIEELAQHAEYNNVGFTYVQTPLLDADALSEATCKKNLKLEVPVIAVLGAGGHCSKFEIQLALRDILLRKGFRVSQIGSKHYSELFGFHSFPSFMFSSNYDEETKIFAFNQHIKNIENQEHPDVIILGIPEGLMKYNERIINKFGILAYEVGCAITPDYTVLALPCDVVNNDYITLLKDCLKYRNSMTLDSLCMSNIHLNEDSVNKEYLPISYDVVPDSFVDLVCKDYTLPSPAIFKSYRETDLWRLAEMICAQLSGNVGRVDIARLTEEVMA